MPNKLHTTILDQIKAKSGVATKHTFLDSYLGNEHPRYPISAPRLREIAREWMRAHRELSPDVFATLLTSLIKGKSSTEKWMAGILLDYSTKAQRTFDPKLFDGWLDHLVGWAEVDAVCTGKYTGTEIIRQWKAWKPLLGKFSRSKNIHKRRASIVFLCSPLRQQRDPELAAVALANIERLKGEKEVLITKAISWVLRSMIKHYREEVSEYVEHNKSTLPAIAVRETLTKLTTGRKTKKKISAKKMDEKK